MREEPQAPQRQLGPVSRAIVSVPPPALVLTSVVSIQLGAAVAVNLFDSLGSVATTFLRLAFAASLLLVARRRQFDRRARDHLGLLLVFGISIGLMNLAFYGAIARIPLGIAVAIEFVGPLGVAALTSRQPREFIWIILAGAGLLLLTPDIGGSLDPLGVVLALVAGAGWAGFVLISPRVARDVGDTGLVLGMAVAALFTLPFAVGAGGLEQLDPMLLAGALAVAVLSSALPLTLEFEALRRMTARAYGVMVTMEPVAAVIVGAVILSQALPPTALVAVALVTIAAIGVNITDRRGSKIAPPPSG